MKYLLVLSLTQIIATIPALRKGNLFERDACPKELPALPGFEFPHLIVPISKAHPDAANPNTFFPAITPGDLGTVFNFDILHDDQVCELGFYFPRQEQLTAPSFTFSGPGTFEVLINEPGQGAESGVTTWNKQPAPAAYTFFPKTLKMSPGNFYSLFTGQCVAGLWSVTISSVDSTFCWFQDYNPCPVGPYVTYNGPSVGKE